MSCVSMHPYYYYLFFYVNLRHRGYEYSCYIPCSEITENGRVMQTDKYMPYMCEVRGNTGIQTTQCYLLTTAYFSFHVASSCPFPRCAPQPRPPVSVSFQK